MSVKPENFLDTAGICSVKKQKPHRCYVNSLDNFEGY